MARALLDVCQDMTMRVGLGTPTAIIKGTGDLPPQYLMMIYETARDLIRRHDWQVLERTATFTSVSGETQAVMTTKWPDFRRIKKNTFVNITQSRPVVPIVAEQHARLRLYGSVANAPYYRISGNLLLFPGNSKAGDSCSFEYTTQQWALSSDGTTYKSMPTADTDLLLLDDEALILGAKWRWKKENGLSYGEDFNDYEKLVQELMGSDREHRNLNLSPRGGGGLVIPEISMGSSTADSSLLTADSIFIDGSAA